MSQVVRTRFAPSPTGQLHIGGVAIALKNYAFAQKHQGQFILRIEDTDKTREVENGVQSLVDQLTSYGIVWDEGPDKGGQYGPYLQSERLDIYQKYAQELVEKSQAYYCFCTKEELEASRQQAQASGQLPRYSQKCRHLTPDQVKAQLDADKPYVIRLKVPANTSVKFTDWIRGDISFESSQIDDQVLIKSDGYPTYHLAVVVDDHLMKITHVMRGEEWISSTPKHILLYQAFGWSPPIFAHIPVFLNPNGKGKMSKRQGDVTAMSFLAKGYVKEAVLNFLMILGWTPQDQRELLTLDEYIKEFDPRQMSQKSVAFDFKKLDWMNGIYIRNMSDAQLMDSLSAFIPPTCSPDMVKLLLPLIKERLVLLSDFGHLTYYFYEAIKPNLTLLTKQLTAPEAKGILDQTIQTLTNLSDWSATSLESQLRQLGQTSGWVVGKSFMLMRVAITGETTTPPLFDTMSVMGRHLVLKRLKASYSML